MRKLALMVIALLAVASVSAAQTSGKIKDDVEVFGAQPDARAASR